MKLQPAVIIFLVITLLILVAGHYWLFYSFVYFFDAESSVIKLVLGIVLGVLAVSFIVATVLAHWRENVVTSNLYLVAAGWLGISLYVAIAAVVALLTLWFFNVEEHKVIIGWVALSLAFAYSGYGIWNAQFPRIKRIKVSSKNFPASWHGRTAVHVSDIHLGVIHHIKFMRRVVELIKKVKPDVMFITGDLYDGVGKELGMLAAPLKDINPPLGTYYITGNHETYIGLDRVFRALKDIPLTIMHDNKIDVDGVQVLGIESHLPGQKKDIKRICEQLDSTRPSIVLYHEPVKEAIKTFQELNINLTLCGHTHKGQLWPFTVITRGMFGRFHTGLNRVGDSFFYTSTGVGTWGPPMRTGNRPEVVLINFTD